MSSTEAWWTVVSFSLYFPSLLHTLANFTICMYLNLLLCPSCTLLYRYADFLKLLCIFIYFYELHILFWKLICFLFLYVLFCLFRRTKFESCNLDQPRVKPLQKVDLWLCGIHIECSWFFLCWSLVNQAWCLKGLYITMTHSSVDRPIKIDFIVLFLMISMLSSFFSFLSMTSPVSARTLPRPRGSAIYPDIFTLFAMELSGYWNSDHF